MGIFSRKRGVEASVGQELVQYLPQDSEPWYRKWHLVKLNLLLLVPLISKSSVCYDGSMMNGLQTLPQWRNYFDNPEGALLGLMNSVYPLGKAISLFFVSSISDCWGRKTSLTIGLVTCVAFPTLQGFAQDFNSFITARSLLGFFTSFISQPSPILVAEFAYPTQRGKATALYNTFFYFGAIFAAWCTFGTFKLSTDWSWRIPSILQRALPAIQLIGLWHLSESPRYLISRGKKEKAREILVQFHSDGDDNSPLVNFEMQEIEAALTEEADTIFATSWLDLMPTAGWNGVGIVSYYLVLVLNAVNFNYLIATFCGALMVDRLGTRTLFLVAGMLVAYVVWTGLTSFFISLQNEAAGRGVVAFIFIHYFFYNIAWTPLLQAYTVEIYLYTLHGRGLSVIYISSFVILIVGNKVNPIARKAIQWKYYIVFCCLLAVLLVVIYFLFPETKGHSLEEIREIFEGKLSDDRKLARAESGLEKENENGELKKKEGTAVKQVELAQ